MPRQWKTKEVTSHGAGITDDIKNAPPSWQEESNNIIYDFKTHNLSNRSGSKILRDAVGDTFNQDVIDALDGFRIEQIFQLENQLLISAWNDSTYSGKVITYDEKTREVTLTKPPTKRKGLDAYSIDPSMEEFYVTVKNSNGMGIEGNLVSFGLDADNTNHIDHLIFWIYRGTGTATVHNYYQRKNVCLFEIGYLELNDEGSVGFAPWEGIRDFLNDEGHDFQLIEGTVATQDIFLDGDLTLSNDYSKAQWGEENPNSEGDLYRPSVTTLGHLQSPVYIGEAFIATEPYDKSFEVNPLDKDMVDPENFPPLTERATIKRISTYWDGNEATSQIRDAQLPTTYVSPLDIISKQNAIAPISADYKFVKFELGFNPSPDDGTFGHNLLIWMDRVSGYTDVVFEGFPPIFIWNVTGGTTTLPAGDWLLLDYPEEQNDFMGMEGEFSMQSGQLGLIRNSPNDTILTGEELIEKIEGAFNDYLGRSGIQYPNLGFAIQSSGVFDPVRSYSTFSSIFSAHYYTSAIPDSIGKYLYNYAFYLRESYTKTDDDVPKLVENNGPAAFIQVATLSELSATSNQVGYWAGNDQGINPPTNTVAISLAPSLIGSVSKRFTRVEKEWFDFNDIVGVFARTQNTGTVYYDVSESNWFVPNQLAAEDQHATFDPADWGGESYGYFVTLTDTNYDRDLLSLELAYFNGGVLSYTGLPQGSKYMDIINGTAYFGSIIDNEARVYQSAPGIPSSAPRLLFSDFEDPMTAVNSFLEKAIVFTENKTWRIEGIKDATGVGRVFLRVISDEFGCIANQSVVKTNIGLFYWSKVGVIYTDGLRAVRVTEHLLERFQTWKGALMPNGLEIGPIGLRGAYDEVSKQILYSGYKPESVVIADDIYVPPVVSPNYVFPKGLVFPKTTILTFEFDLTLANSTTITIGGYDGSPVVFSVDNNTTMNAIADSIAVDFPALAVGDFDQDVSPNELKITLLSASNNLMAISAVVILGASQPTVSSSVVTQNVFSVNTKTNDSEITFLEIVVRDDGDAFWNEISAYNNTPGKIIKVIDANYDSWTFITNYAFEGNVTRVTETGYYVVQIEIVDDADNIWRLAVMWNGVLTDKVSKFASYAAFDYAKWNANNTPGQYEITDPENFTYYSFRFSTSPNNTKVSVEHPGAYTMTFVGELGPDWDNFLAELQYFMATAGELLWVTDNNNIQWKLTSIGISANNVVLSDPTTIIMTLEEDNPPGTEYVTVTKDDNISSIGDLNEDFPDWNWDESDPWYQYQGMGFRKSEHLGIKHPLLNPYGVPNWILCDLYYGVSKHMPFYTADGPSLLQDDRRFKKDAFQTRVMWFSEDTLNVYRGQIGYDAYDTSKVLGSVILTHGPEWTYDEIYETLDHEIYSPIDPLYKSIALSHGSKGTRKWTSRVMINFHDVSKTGVSIQPLGWNDLNPTPHKLAKCINYQHFTENDFSPPMNPAFPQTIIQYFKNTDASIYGEHLISYNRRFPKGRIRNVYKQFGFEQLVQEYLNFSTDSGTKTYYPGYTFPVGLDDIGFNRYVDSGGDGFGLRELAIIIAEADVPAFKYDLDTVAVGFSVVDANGDLWEYQNANGLLLYTEEEQGGIQTRFFIQMTDANGENAFGVLYKNGVKVPFEVDGWEDFYLNFGAWFRGDEVAFAAANPLGLGNETGIPAYTGVTITKIADEPFSPVVVRVDFNLLKDTYIVGNGVSYAQFSWSDDWFRIVQILNDNINGGDPTYLEFIALTSLDALSTSGIVITDQSVLIGRSPLDQGIQLSDWAVTYTMLGDRTQGLPKATELGGHN